MSFQSAVEAAIAILQEERERLVSDIAELDLRILVLKTGLTRDIVRPPERAPSSKSEPTNEPTARPAPPHAEPVAECPDPSLLGLMPVSKLARRWRVSRWKVLMWRQQYGTKTIGPGRPRMVCPDPSRLDEPADELAALWKVKASTINRWKRERTGAQVRRRRVAASVT